MSSTFYSLLHVLSVLLLTATTFQAFARPEASLRRPILIRSGIFSLAALVAGVGLLHKLNLGFPGWVIVKLGAWLLLSALAGVAFRQPGKTGFLGALATLALGAAVYAVYFRPF
jgi:hypothetical protein